MKFPFRIEVQLNAEVESMTPDGEGNIEVTLSANGKQAKCYYDADRDDHGTLQEAQLSLMGYRRDGLGKRPWQPTPHVSAEPTRIM